MNLAFTMSVRPTTLHPQKNHLSHFILERVMGIEPTCPAWKAGALPLSYTRLDISNKPLNPLLPTKNMTYFDYHQTILPHPSWWRG